MNVHFAVITDLHVDIMHDGVARMQAFCEAAVAEHVDFFCTWGICSIPRRIFCANTRPKAWKSERAAPGLCATGMMKSWRLNA